MQLLLQFYAHSFETVSVFRSWSEEDIILRLFLSPFFKLELSHFSDQSEELLGILYMQLLLQIPLKQMFRSWFEDVHIVWISPSTYYLSLFFQVELSHFSGVITIKVKKIVGLVCAQPLLHCMPIVFI